MSTIPTTTVTELPDDAVIVDVREADEWAAGHAPNAVHIPLSDLPARPASCPTPTTRSRSSAAAADAPAGAVVAAQQGFDVANVEGGMRAWHSAGEQLAAPESSASSDTHPGP